MPTQLEKRFYEAMVEIYRRAKEEEGYNASRFLSMLVDHGGVETARILINGNQPSDGYTALHQLGRLDLSVEAVVVCNSTWHELFTAADLAAARKRLRAYEFECPGAEPSEGAV